MFSIASLISHEGGWEVCSLFPLVSKCRSALPFQMLTTSPAGSRNVPRLRGVGPLLAPLTSVPWWSRMNTSSFRWVQEVHSVIEGRCIGDVTCCLGKWGWFFWGCEGVELSAAPGLLWGRAPWRDLRLPVKAKGFVAQFHLQGSWAAHWILRLGCCFIIPQRSWNDRDLTCGLR